jgi:hypothetical protein
VSFDQSLRLALLGGRVDRLRFAITALGAALTAFILLTAAVVMAIPDGRGYRVEVLNDAGLHGGVAFALILLSLPALVLTGLGVRVGSPGRDRRLAAFRLAGMTPAEARRVVSQETGLAAAAGSAVGGAALLVARVLLKAPGSYSAVVPTAEGRTRRVFVTPGPGLPVDVSPHWWAAALALLLVPVGAVLLSRLALRRVALTPFGVVRRERRRPPAVLPVIALVVGAAAFAWWNDVVERLGQQDHRWLFMWPPMLFVVVILGALLFGTASVSHLLGRLLAGHPPTVAALIAARRMVADPWSASRATASVILSVLFGAGAAAFTMEANLQRPDTSFFASTFDVIAIVVGVALVLGAAGLLVIQLESMMLRRRTLASLAVAGVPRSVLVRAHLIETLLPVVPMVLVAAAVGTVAMRGRSGGGRLEVANDPSGNWDLGTHFIPIPVAWADLGMFVGGAVLAVLLTTLVGAASLRSSMQASELRTAA